ncbi:AP-4 complex subunit beta-1 isoform X2 [Hydra vulgaris]|uniref:AP-4 complex subunit beta-1 isoform X2 n=1 Tax=Hydra vulgaris TaxID=6087 RepID=UPI001F5FF0C3|nr:AP-4 complex subunit beta-1 [Hydra vulgaris]
MQKSSSFASKSEVSQLRLQLINACLKKDANGTINALKQIVVCMTQSVDVTSLLPDIIREACATTNLVQKKLVYLYICTCAESNSDLALLTVNTLVKDAINDVNPMVRGLALRSMTSMRISNLVEYIKQPLLSGLRDSSSYVRRNAVMACAKLFQLDENVFKDLGLINILKDMLFDDDPQVSANAFFVLDVVLDDSDATLLQSEILFFFFERITLYNEWSLCMLFQRFSKYKPKDEDEGLKILNILDSFLKHRNHAVIMATVNIFLQFSTQLDFIKSDIFERIKAPILSIISISSHEVSFSVLNHVSALLKMRPRMFCKDYKVFFLRNNEPTYLQLKKIEILTKVVTEGNMNEILAELIEHAHDVDTEVSYASAKALGSISLNFPFTTQPCLNSLVSLLKLEVDYITANSIEVIQDILSENVATDFFILPELDRVWDQVQNFSLGKAAIIWIYGEFGQNIDVAPYNLETLVDHIEDENCLLVKLNLLTALVKLFLKRPPECQKILGKFLKYCIESEINFDIRDRAKFYISILESSVEEARRIVLSTPQSIKNVDASISNYFYEQDFLFEQFNTLSVIYNRSMTSISEEKKAYSSETSVLQKNILVADLLGVDDKKISLSEEDFLDCKSFEEIWKCLKYSENFEKEFSVCPSHEEIISIMKAACIHNIAFSPKESNNWKFFFYAQENITKKLIFMEIVVQRLKRISEVTIKSDNELTLRDFVLLCRRILYEKLNI